MPQGGSQQPAQEPLVLVEAAALGAADGHADWAVGITNIGHGASNGYIGQEDESDSGGCKMGCLPDTPVDRLV